MGLTMLLMSFSTYLVYRVLQRNDVFDEQDLSARFGLSHFGSFSFSKLPEEAKDVFARSGPEEANKMLEVSTTTAFAFDCIAGYGDCQKEWSDIKQSWCANHEKRHCQQTVAV